MMGHKICFYEEIWIIIPKLFQYPFLSGALGELLFVGLKLFCMQTETVRQYPCIFSIFVVSFSLPNL